MRYDERFLDEVKGRLRLSEVIGKTVKLRRQGREFVGLSPFTQERTPSFFVNDDKGFFHDFSSGKHGDLISFLQETERLSFTEAVERLAAEAGVPLPAPDPRSEAQERERQGLVHWLELASAWFEAELRRPAGRAAAAYLAARGLPESEWGRFHLGYAPGGRTALKDYLIAKGARPEDLIASGLVIAPDDGGSPFDRFRDRIMFPIGDRRIASFGGRAMDPAAPAKYLNGPDTALFDKGRTLYGLAEARRLLHAGGAEAPLVVVEGYMDVIACQRSGVAAVAGMGTALTEAQMEMLWRLHPEPTLCFDADRAGMAAGARAIERALPRLRAGRSFRFAQLSGGKDPDDVLREQGPAALKAQLGKTMPFVEALFRRECDLAPLDTPERRADLRARLRAAAQAIAEPDLSGEYRRALDALYARLFAPTANAARTPAGGRRRWRDAPFIAPSTAEGRAGAKRLARALAPGPAALAHWAILDPAVVDDHLEALAAHGFGDPALAGLAGTIVRLRLSAERLDSDALQRHLADSGFALLSDIDRAASQSGAPFMKPDVTLTAARSQWSRAMEAMCRLAALDEALTAARDDLVAGVDSSAHRALKLERDRLRRAVETGTMWADEPDA